VAAPLYRPRDASMPVPSDRAALEARRDVLVAELREIGIDHAAGVLDDADYARARTTAEAEAARIVRALAAGAAD
jgi:hypothetical protein